jgi:hypothetical protein
VTSENPLTDAAATFESRHLTGADGWKLRVMSWTPRDGEAARRSPVLFLPGYISVVEGWLSLLAAWVEVRPIHYIETREKNHTESPPGHKEGVADFVIPVHARDLAAVAAQLGVGREGDWFTSSLGSTSLLDGLKSGVLGARSAFLLAPNARFELPWWAAALAALPWWSYPPVIHGILLPYLRWKIKETEQRVRSSHIVRNADMRRFKLSTQANRRYSVWPELETIETRCAICVAASDTLHGHDDVLRIARSLPNARLIEIESNQFAHEAGLLPIVERWLAGQEGGAGDGHEPDASTTSSGRRSS